MMHPVNILDVLVSVVENLNILETEIHECTAETVVIPFRAGMQYRPRSVSVEEMEVTISWYKDDLLIADANQWYVCDQRRGLQSTEVA